MNVSESCSCGASFSAEGDNVVRLLREWRRDHVCVEKSESAGETFVTANSQVEQVLGFQMSGLTIPGRQDHALEDDD